MYYCNNNVMYLSKRGGDSPCNNARFANSFEPSPTPTPLLLPVFNPSLSSCNDDIRSGDNLPAHIFLKTLYNITWITLISILNDSLLFSITYPSGERS